MSLTRLNLLIWTAVAALTLLLAVATLYFDSKEPWSWLESKEHASRIGPVGHWVDGKPPTIHYSERVYWDALFRTRINTWSNMAFVVVGFYAFALGWRDHYVKKTPSTGYLARTPLMSVLFGFGCVSLGFGSGLYHASLTRMGHQLDVANMWMPMIGLIAINIGRWIPHIRLGRGWVLPMAWITTIVYIFLTLYFYYYKWSFSTVRLLFTLIGILAIFGILDLCFRLRGMRLRWVFFGGLFLALAFICRQLDAAGRFSGPDDWWQGHSLWHVLTALCLVTIYRYLRSEQING